MSPASEVEDVVSPHSYTDQSQSSEDTSTVISTSTMSSAASTNNSAGSASATSFSVINYVGKAHKQSSHRSTGRCRTPYDRQTLSRTSRVEPLDETTNSSTASSVDYCSATGDSASLSGDPAEMIDLDENTRTGAEQQQLLQAQPRLRRSRSQRSMSISSSGCSSSMDDRNCDFSPFGSINGCRCTSMSISDFDDDGFREDVSLSSVYSVFSGPRSYQPHHPLHHNHQNVPYHPHNSKGLFDIALKTVKLIRRNQELQLRLAQLQEETKAFIESVMANPENEPLRSHYQTAAGSSRAAAASAVSTVLVQK